MAEREKTMKGLEICTKSMGFCEGCPYLNDTGITCDSMTEVMRDALALLREQEERIKFLEKWIAYLEGGDPYEGNGVLSHD